MKLIFLILSVLVVAISALYGQEIQKCDENILLRTSNGMGDLSQKDIRYFLKTFSRECRNNVEYSEWSNELLFSLLDQQTEITLKTIDREEKRIEMEEIFFNLSTPVNDLINVKDVMAKVDQVAFDAGLKKKILARLKEADSKSN